MDGLKNEFYQFSYSRLDYIYNLLFPGTPLFVDGNQFYVPYHYGKIMGYDKPLDFSKKSSEWKEIEGFYIEANINHESITIHANGLKQIIRLVSDES